MNSLTTVKDILKAVLHCINSISFDVGKLLFVTTYGAPARTRKVKGFTTLLKNHRVVILTHSDNFIKLNCVIHQDALCAKTENLQSVMNIVM